MQRMPRLIRFVCCVAILAAITSTAVASDFNLPFVSVSGLGNTYAGWAASAEDASTAYTNPAGLAFLNHQQLVFAGMGVTGSTQYTGTASLPSFPFAPPQEGVASSKIRGLIPALYYSAPAYKNMYFGVSQTVPFALGTNYATDSIVRYSATRTQITVIDLSPSLAIKISNQFSVGLGFDAARATFTLNHTYGPPVAFIDTPGQNHIAGWAYGWHGGILYQVLPTTRLGLSFNSALQFHLTGDSEVFNPTFEFRTTNQKANQALPARTQLSVNQDINNQITVMATLFYTNWRTLNQLTLKNTAIPCCSTAVVGVPFGYHNTFDYAVGVKYKATPQWLFRAGAEFANAPSNNRDRSVSNPIGGEALLGIGAHYQQTTDLSYEIAYARGIFQTTHINATNPLSSLAGHSSMNSNILGGQVTWTIS